MNKSNMKTLNEQQTTFKMTKFIYYSIFIITYKKKLKYIMFLNYVCEFSKNV